MQKSASRGIGLPYCSEYTLSNAPVKSHGTNGNGMGGISFLTTDNWLKSLKYSILIGLNQFLPENATNFADYSPESPNLRTDWSKSIVVQIRGKFVCEQWELFIKQRL